MLFHTANPWKNIRQEHLGMQSAINQLLEKAETETNLAISAFSITPQNWKRRYSMIERITQKSFHS
jgi:hypothetical protein